MTQASPPSRASAGRSTPTFTDRPWSRKLALILLDAAIFAVSVWLAFMLRFDFVLEPRYRALLVYYLVAAVPVRVLVQYLLRAYDMSLRFVSLADLWNLARAHVIAAVVLVLYGGLFVPHFLTRGRVPLGAVALDFLMALAGASLLRITKRTYVEILSAQAVHKETDPATRTLIVGAGDAADQVLRHIKRSGDRRFVPVAMLDDDPAKLGQRMQGVPIVGTLAELGEVVKSRQIHTVMVAIPSARTDVLRRVYTEAQRAGVRNIQMLSSSLVSGPQHFEVSVKDIRDLRIEDLLGRDPVQIDPAPVRSYLRDARVLITGAAGSIGSEIVRQVCQYGPSAVLCVDIDETGLFDLHRALSDAARDAADRVVPEVVVADVRNAARMDDVMRDFQPTVVFHAAAYKHVPMMEAYPEEAIGANVRGTFTVASAAARFGVEVFIFISTDKAVNPRNVMGASKRVAGRIVCGLQKKCRTRFLTVRFGNVLGSRGSVIPIFLDQLRHGGPLTVTHPDMVRYFMTIPEAVALVLQTGAIGKGGEVFVLDMGEPMRIMALAEEVIRMHGKVPHEDIKIEVVGMRPGEKMYEELLTAEEGTTSTRHAKIMVANLSADEASVEPDAIMQSFQQILDAPLPSAERRERIVQELKRWVPSYVPNRDGRS